MYFKDTYMLCPGALSAARLICFKKTISSG